MEERIDRPATRFAASTSAPGEPRTPRSGAAYESPTALEVSLCCEISAYAPDDDDRPLF